MDTPTPAPSTETIPQWRDFALAYLRGQLKEFAPAQLGEASIFDRSPLEGDGAACIFDFLLTRGGGQPERCYVVVGHTEPNYYPAYDLTLDEAYSLHVGTRFMLVVSVAQCDWRARAGYDPQADARQIVDRVAPAASIDELSVATSFDVEGQLHVVLKARVAGEPVFIMAGDAPHGFSRRVHLPVPAAYRLHLGEVLRQEPAPVD
jgi:hypothetical protein